MTADLPSLVSVQWLALALGPTDLKMVDATWFLPSEDIDSVAAFKACHIPSAVHFDVDAIKDHSVDLPHMLPSANEFARAVGALGLGSDDRIVVYDRNGMAPSARVWWTFRAFGHTSVAVLDGGFEAWLDQGGDTSNEACAPADTLYHATYDPGVVCSLEEMRALTTDQNPPEQIIDARSPGRFLGTEPEPRPGVRAGRMPGSLNVPSTGMIDTDTGLLLDTAALRDRFEAAGVDLTRPMVTSCGSGVTAAFLAFALHQIGAPDAAVYDGSWTEWGGLQDTPIDR